MFSWLNESMEKAKQDMENMVNEASGMPKHENIKTPEKEPLYAPFKLPMQYLEKEQIHELSSVVSDDLELYESKGERSIYDITMQPGHPFGKDVFALWNQQYTSNVEFLEESQAVLRESPYRSYSLKHELLMEMWKDCKGNKEYFLEKYGYVEWDMLKSFNRSSMFLQILSMINMSSPLISMVLPIFFLLLPFVVLRLRGIPITFQDYLVVLQQIAKNHFIGRLLACFSEMSLQNLMYVLAMGGLYCYQMYHNVVSCMRFYNNIHKVNHYLCTLKEYLQDTRGHMQEFVSLHKEKTHYQAFCTKTQQHCIVLEDFIKVLEPIQPVNQFIYKLGSVGYLLKCYYELHAHPEYEQSIRYSFGFEGYLDNLHSIQRHLQENKVQYVSFSNKKATKFEDQYYPFHMEEPKCITNSCDLKKKIIITGPNASGKTTLLKTHTINVLMCQQFGVGFFKKGILRPYTHIHSYLNIPDTSERDSLFQAESRRCKDILDSIQKYPEEQGYRHYCIFDELYSGTNPEEASNSAHAFLKYMGNFSHVDFILTTHYTSVCSKLSKSKYIKNYKMDVGKKGDKLIYKYKMKRGISKIQGAFTILEEMNYPKEILESVKEEKKEKQANMHTTEEYNNNVCSQTI